MLKTKHIAILSVLAIITVSLLSFIKEPSPKIRPQAKPLNIILVIVDQWRADATKREGFKLTALRLSARLAVYLCLLADSQVQRIPAQILI